MIREERVGWGNIALFAVVIACLSVAGLAVYEVSCSEPPGAGAP
jgi:hypothetical protein